MYEGARYNRSLRQIWSKWRQNLRPNDDDLKDVKQSDPKFLVELIRLLAKEPVGQTAVLLSPILALVMKAICAEILRTQPNALEEFDEERKSFRLKFRESIDSQR